MIIRYVQGSCTAFGEKGNLSVQPWISLVQLTHMMDVDTPITLHNKWHFITGSKCTVLVFFIFSFNFLLNFLPQNENLTQKVTF